MDIRHTGNRFFSRYQIVGGQTILGQMLDIPDTTRVSNFHGARRLFRTNTGSALTSNQLLDTPDGERFLVGDHGKSFGQTYFKLFLMTEKLRWQRAVKVQDDVTGLDKDDPLTFLGVIDGTFEEKGDIYESPGVRQNARTLLTNAPILVGDVLNGRAVSSSERFLGIVVAELE